MTNKHLLILFTIVAQAFCSCEKLELPKEQKEDDSGTKVERPLEKPTETSKDEENSDSIGGNGTSNPSWGELALTIGTDPDNPVSVAEMRGLVEQILAETGYAALKKTYVTGYIVGSIKKGGKNISSTIFCVSDVASNIVIADSPNESDYKKCVAVELASNSSARIKLNLQDNPDNLHKKILVLGTIEKYMGVLGVKSTKLVKIYEEE